MLRALSEVDMAFVGFISLIHAPGAAGFMGSKKSWGNSGRPDQDPMQKLPGGQVYPMTGASPHPRVLASLLRQRNVDEFRAVGDSCLPEYGGHLVSDGVARHTEQVCAHRVGIGKPRAPRRTPARPRRARRRS